MTVLTKPVSEMKKKSPMAVPLVEAEQPIDGAGINVVVSVETQKGILLLPPTVVLT